MADDTMKGEGMLSWAADEPCDAHERQERFLASLRDELERARAALDTQRLARLLQDIEDTNPHTEEGKALRHRLMHRFIQPGPHANPHATSRRIADLETRVELLNHELFQTRRLAGTRETRIFELELREKRNVRWPELRVLLESSVRDHLGPTVTLHIEPWEEAGEHHCYGSCVRCEQRLQGPSARAFVITQDLLQLLGESAPRGCVTWRLSEDARRAAAISSVGALIANAMGTFSCSCVRDFLAEQARARARSHFEDRVERVRACRPTTR